VYRQQQQQQYLGQYQEQYLRRYPWAYLAKQGTQQYQHLVLAVLPCSCRCDMCARQYLIPVCSRDVCRPSVVLQRLHEPCLENTQHCILCFSMSLKT
jgi:hypothetical protein